jgi:hypothetical protein
MDPRMFEGALTLLLRLEEARLISRDKFLLKPDLPCRKAVPETLAVFL